MSIDTESVYVLSCDGCDIFVTGDYGWAEADVRECVPEWSFTDNGDFCRACSRDLPPETTETEPTKETGR